MMRLSTEKESEEVGEASHATSTSMYTGLLKSHFLLFICKFEFDDYKCIVVV